MPRTTFRAAAYTVILSVWSLNSAFAQAPISAPEAGQGAAGPPVAADNQSVDQAGYHAGVYLHHPGPIPAPLYLPPNAPGLARGQYPALNAPLYPCPLPNIPYQTGGSLITNQAFYPHEMLYPHTYRSVYPPYYYEVHGGWKLFPWGVWQGEHWRLRGTVVTVKYSPSIGLFSGYVPPALNTLNVVRPHPWEEHWNN